MNFTSHLGDVESTLGETVTLTSELSKPGLEVEWLKNNELLSLGDSKYETVNQDCTYQLVIPNVTEEDSGAYTVSAGDVQSTAAVVIRGSFLLQNFFPLFFPNVDSNILTLQQNLNSHFKNLILQTFLFLSLTSNVLSFSTGSLQGIKYYTLGRCQEWQNVSLLHFLKHFPNSQKGASTSPVDHMEMHATESDEGPEESDITVSTPSLSDSDSEQLVGEQTPVTFLCVVAKGNKPVTFFKDGRELKDGVDGCIITVEGDTWKLTIPKSEEANLSVYTAKCGEEDVPIKTVTAGKQIMHFSELWGV